MAGSADGVGLRRRFLRSGVRVTVMGLICLGLAIPEHSRSSGGALFIAIIGGALIIGGLLLLLSANYVGQNRQGKAHDS